MPRVLRRLLTWIIVLFGALLVFTGIFDIAVGPESEVLETGEGMEFVASRWWGLAYIAVGAAIIALSIRLDRDPPKAP